MAAANESPRVRALVDALGLDAQSFEALLEWVLSEQLVEALKSIPPLGGPDFFRQPDAMRRMREVLEHRTGRQWAAEDVRALFDRLEADTKRHHRLPVSIEDKLRLYATQPLRCRHCDREPPEVILHIDHIVPVSKGGSSKHANLQFLCRDCNLKKSNKREVGAPWLTLR